MGVFTQYVFRMMGIDRAAERKGYMKEYSRQASSVLSDIFHFVTSPRKMRFVRDSLQIQDWETLQRLLADDMN